MGFLEDFINANYIQPLCRYYTLPATITYGLILVVAVYGTYKMLQKLKIEINRDFLIALLPFIIYGGSTRALRDYGISYQGNLFCSPPIYFFVFAITLGSLLLSRGFQIAVEKKYPHRFHYHKTMFVIGFLFLLYNISLITIVNYFAFGLILVMIGIWAAIFFGIHYFKPKLLSFENAGIIVSHLFDASSSFVAIQFFGYYEQHVLPSFLINVFGGPWIMFPLKIIVVWIVLDVIDKEKGDKFFKNFLKIIILILGLALGTRDFITVAMRPV